MFEKINVIPTMEEYIKSLQKEIENRDNFIREFESDCIRQSCHIPEKVCKRAIKRINKELKPISLCDDFPTRFSFFDRLSILLQSNNIDELGFPNGVLSEYIENVLEDEFDKLAPIEKLVMYYSDCECNSFGEYTTNNVVEELFDYFIDMADSHIKCSKIENYLMRM